MRRLVAIVGGGLLIAALLAAGAAGGPAGAVPPSVWPQPSPSGTTVINPEPDDPAESPKPSPSDSVWTQPPSPAGTPPPGTYPCVRPPVYPQQPRECLNNWLWPEKKA